MTALSRIRQRLTAGTGLTLLALGALSLGTAEEPAGTGAIRGTVVFAADPARPWSYGRYYIKDRKTGQLAEAVVALDGRLKGPAADKPQTWLVDQRDYRFDPETVVVRAGDTVKFTNSDPQIHNVHATGTLQTFDVSIGPGGETQAEFPKGGGLRRPVSLGCKFHNVMRGWIYVFDHPWYQLTAADGRFDLAGVPPGEYRLTVIHPAGGWSRTQPVQVVAGKTTDIELKLTPDDRLTP